MTALEAYILARAYTRQAIEGAGALKGAPCQIQSIEAITGGNRITFAWETSEGETETDTLDVMDGADGDDGVGIASITYKETDAQGNNIYTVTLTSGSTYDITCPKGAQGETGATGATGNGIVSIAKTSTEGLVDTYTITYTNGNTSAFTVTNGETPTVDSEMSESSENPLQNKVITAWTSADTKSVTGNPITISDAAAVKAKALSMSIEPVQDLHGYDKPWVGGANKNKAKPKNYSSDSYDGTTFSSPIEGAKVIDDVVLPAGTYVASIKMLSVPSTQRTLTFYKTGDVELAYFVNLNEKTVGQVYTTTFTLSEESTVYAKSWATGGGEWKMQMQLEAGETATTFAPYTNICPISGHTEAVVTREGKNLWRGKFVNTNFEEYSTYNDGPSYAKAVHAGSGNMQVFPGQTYRYSVDGTAMEMRYIVFDNDDNIIVPFTTSYYITIPNNGTRMKWRSIDDVGSQDVKAQLEIGETATSFVPYVEPHTATITFGEEVYGGTVNFKTGLMTVTHGIADLGALTWTYNSSDKIFYSASNSIPNCYYDNGYGVAICEAYAKHDTTGSEMNNGTFKIQSAVCYIKNLDYTVASDLKTSLDGIHIVYKLATPTTIQLTPTQIQLLKGTNTLTANGANISLTYQQDNLVGEVMEQVEPQIDGLQGQIDEIPRLVDYSTTEQKTGQKWIDGKDIYVKSFGSDGAIGASPINISHGITNIDKIIKKEGSVYWGSSYHALNLDYAEPSNSEIYSVVTSDTIKIVYGGVYTGVNAITGYNVTLYYTKSTT